MKTQKLFMAFVTSIVFMVILTANSCKKCEQESRCNLTYDTGPCKANFPKYYYDMKDNKCKEFIYGGCDGEVPFETLEDCQKQCECMK